MFEHINTLYSYKDLLRIWTAREIKVRYKQSLLGGAWAILQPLALTIMFTVVFSFFVRLPSDEIPYPIFIYTAMLPWTFLATSISFGVPSLVTNLNLVTKVYFPKEVLPMASIGAAFFDFLVASSVYVLLMFYYRVAWTWTLLWVPLLITVQLTLILGVVLIGSTLNVFYRDVRFTIPLGLQLWMYASPVIYPVSAVPENLLPLYMLNPMAGLIDSYRRVILLGEPPVTAYLVPAVVISAIICLIGYYYFKRKEWQFADII